MIVNEKIPLEKISDDIISSAKVNLYVLRLDKIHPDISGNKWYKLKYNLEEARKQKKNTLLTFGGAYSNHIAATAAAGKEFGFKTIGIIRGDELEPHPPTSLASPLAPLLEERGWGEAERGEQPLNRTLRFAKECGMKLHFVSREEYRKKDSSEVFHSITQSLNNFYLLPEGGTNELAVKGCSEILSLVDIPFNYVCCPVGTGGTIAGIISSLKGNQKAIGFSVLKGGEFLKTSKVLSRVLGIEDHSAIWNLNHDYHFGGYAKHTPQLLKFISDFAKQNNIPLEQVYTGKMMFGIYDLIQKNYFQKGSIIIAIHTGGLQGRLTSVC